MGNDILDITIRLVAAMILGGIIGNGKANRGITATTGF